MWTDNHIFLRYEIKLDHVVNSTGAVSHPPSPVGMSGAFILALGRFDARSSDIWSLELANVIAVQSSWDERNWIKSTKIHDVRELLSEIELS